MLTHLSRNFKNPGSAFFVLFFSISLRLFQPHIVGAVGTSHLVVVEAAITVVERQKLVGEAGLMEANCCFALVCSFNWYFFGGQYWTWSLLSHSVSLQYSAFEDCPQVSL